MTSNGLHGGNEDRQSGHPDASSHVSSGRPSFGSVRRYEVALPAGTYCGVPGRPEVGGGFGLASGGGSGTVANTLLQALFGPLTLGQKTQQLGPIRAIAIAPDSPIDAVDLWFGDENTANRFRVAKGHPFIGDVSDVDHVWMTLPEALADPFDADDNVDAAAAANWALRNHIWDSQVNNATAAVGARIEMQMPVRLDVYRGELPPMTMLRRAPYLADFGGDNRNAGGGTLTYAKLWVATQGRAKTEVTVRNTSTAAENLLVTIAGYRPVLKRGGGSTIIRPLVSRVEASFVLAAGDSRMVDIDDRYQWVGVTLAPGDSTLTDFHGVVHVRSEDA